jgi:putative phosphoribosyl transferase
MKSIAHQADRSATMESPMTRLGRENAQAVEIPIGGSTLAGDLTMPAQTAGKGMIVFAQGSGSSRRSPRNRFVAELFQQEGFGTLLFDLFTSEEEEEDACTGHRRFDIPLLSDRLIAATQWLTLGAVLREVPIGYFGASTGAAAALVAAAKLPLTVNAVVSRGGRPDLAGAALSRVEAPTLLIVGGQDKVVLERNDTAYRKLQCKKRLFVVPGATHVFAEPGALDCVASLAVAWFRAFLYRDEEGRSYSCDGNGFS